VGQPADLFGLYEQSANPGLTCRRLHRYDDTGLICLLRGRPEVVALSAEGPAIGTVVGGAVTSRPDEPASHERAETRTRTTDDL
jgi:hypothetical protein